MSDSSVYVVSPPTLYMPTSGLAFCLISNDPAWQAQVIAVIESGVEEQLTFYANETAVQDPKAWIWYWHVIDNCDMILCDTASCSEHEKLVAIAMTKLELPVVFYVKPGDDELVSLLNSIEVPFFDDMDKLPGIMEAGFGA